MNSISVVFITEKGRLERESKLLVDSIRQFGGKFKDVPIYSYQPRLGNDISKTTREFLIRNSVEIISEPLNVKYKDYGLANKIMVCAHAEANLNTDYMVFFDTDTILLKEPTAFYELGDADIGMVPVFRKLSMAVLEDEENYHYWKEIYDLLNISTRSYVTTVVDNLKILAYFNSGLLIANREKNLFQQAKENFDRIKQAKLSIANQYFVEQCNLSATAIQLNLKIKELGKGYNYPLRHHLKVINPSYKVDTLEEVSTAHYTGLFRKPNNEDRRKLVFEDGEKGAWIEEMSKKHGVFSDTPWYKKIWKKG